MRKPFLLASALLLLAASLAAAQTPIQSAHGIIEKLGTDSLTLRPRGPEGRFGKSIVLKLTGTSKLTLMVAQKRGGKTTITQRDTELKKLEPHQTVAVLYASVGSDHVLLAAVALPPGSK